MTGVKRGSKVWETHAFVIYWDTGWVTYKQTVIVTYTLTYWFLCNEIVATRCQFLRVNKTKFGFGWGSAPAEGVEPSYSLTASKGASSKERV